MAGNDELGKFVQKFVSLWQSGSNARLHVESEAGFAHVSLQVDLGQAKPLCGVCQHGRGQGHRGGSPAKQRRRERRESERKAKATAEQAVVEEKVGQEKSAAEEVVLGKDSCVAEEANKLEIAESEKSEIDYELKIEAHEKCKNFDVVEVIEVNFDGILDDLKIDKHDPSRQIIVQKVKEEPIENDNEHVHLIYRVQVKNTEVARSLIESWKDAHKFDDLAFGNSVYDQVQVKIKEVQKINR
jgi:hypothetical protein